LGSIRREGGSNSETLRALNAGWRYLRYGLPRADGSPRPINVGKLARGRSGIGRDGQAQNTSAPESPE